MPRLASMMAGVAFGAVLATDGAQAAEQATMRPVYDIGFRSIDGTAMPLEQWRGKVLLVVNTASFCGYTPQYEGLQKLWSDYEAKGLVVIGVPSNDFGEQEPEGEAKIKEFCTGAYGVTFPLTAKYQVKGAGAHPFYRWAAAALGSQAEPRWNFHKILVGRDGRAVAAFETRIKPESSPVRSAIERELAKP